MHVLITHLREARHGMRLVAFVRAFALPFRAVRFLMRHRSLWPFVIAPALVNIALFAGGVVVVVLYAGSVADLLWSQPEVVGWISGLQVGLWYVMYAVLLVLGLAVAYIGTLLLGGIVASPFNDALAERVEHLLMGEAPVEAVERSLWQEGVVSVWSSARIALCYGAMLVPVLLLNLIPIVGSLVATGLSVGIGAFFLALEYADVVLARRGLALREKMRLLRRHWPLAGGFGLSTSLLLWIPLVNFLSIPIAVVGGTALALALITEQDSP